MFKCPVPSKKFGKCDRWTIHDTGFCEIHRNYAKNLEKASAKLANKKEMECLNDPESEIYIKTLEKQVPYITQRLTIIKNRLIADTMGCCGGKEEIAKHLNMGLAQNLIQTFFKTTDTCDFCKSKIGDNGIRQIERAHCNLYSRYDLIMMAVNDLHIDTNTPIKSGDILKLFIQKHEICPIYMLCNLCHTKYDN